MRIAASCYRLPLRVALDQQKRNWMSELQRILGGVMQQEIADPKSSKQRGRGSSSDHPVPSSAAIELTVCSKQELYRQLRQDPSHLPGFCLLQATAESCLADLRLMHGLYQSGSNVIALISRPMNRLQSTFRQAGCLDTVTSILELSKVGRMIRVAVQRQPRGYRDWRSEFLARLPWPPVDLSSGTDWSMRHDS